MTIRSCFCGILLVLTGCLDRPSFVKPGEARLGHRVAPLAATDSLPDGVPPGAVLDPDDPTTVIVKSEPVEGGVKAGLRAGSPLAQKIVVPDGEPIAGTTVTFPPGAIAIDTEISVVASATLATPAVAAMLENAPTFTQAGAAVTIASKVPFTPPQPFVVALPLPTGAGAGLVETNDASLAILYDVLPAESATRLVGLIPRSELDVEATKVSFKARYFGTYQVVVVTPAVKVVEKPGPRRQVYREGVSWLAASKRPVPRGGLAGWLAPMKPTAVAKGGERLELDIVHRWLPGFASGEN